MINKYLVEFIGTTFFIYVVLTTGNALAIGGALTIAVLLGGKISGGHYSPAVTIIMTAAGKMPRSELLPYIIAQVLGGLTALELFKRVKV